MDASDIEMLTQMSEELLLARVAVTDGYQEPFEAATSKLRSLCRCLDDRLLRMVMGRVVQLLDVLAVEEEEEDFDGLKLGED